MGYKRFPFRAESREAKAEGAVAPDERIRCHARIIRGSPPVHSRTSSVMAARSIRVVKRTLVMRFFGEMNDARSEACKMELPGEVVDFEGTVINYTVTRPAT